MTSPFRNNFFWLIGICFCCQVQGQSFRNKAAIDSVGKAGFYAIGVTPSLSSHVKTDFSDLRIADENANPVPYVLKSNIPLLKHEYFKPFKIISNTLTDSGKTVVVIENSEAEKITGFSLQIRNATVSRTMDVSGGDDKIHWFSIAEDINLGRRYIADSVSYMENIGFSLSAYKYFRIIIYNGKNDPLNIVAAGRYVSSDMSAGSGFVINPAMKYVQYDSNDHISYITVFNPEKIHISHVVLRVKGPKFFKRQVDVLTENRTLGNFIISADTAFHFSLPVFNDSFFVVKIYNEDNPKLKIGNLSTSQDAEKIIAYLEPGKSYELEMTNENARAPHYDLEDFKDSIPADVAAVKFSSIEPILVSNSIKEKSIFSQAWLWPVMIAVLLVLILFTFRLTKEMSKRS